MSTVPVQNQFNTGRNKLPQIALVGEVGCFGKAICMASPLKKKKKKALAFPRGKTKDIPVTLLPYSVWCSVAQSLGQVYELMLCLNSTSKIFFLQWSTLKTFSFISFYFLFLLFNLFHLIFHFLLFNFNFIKFILSTFLLQKFSYICIAYISVFLLIQSGYWKAATGD